MNELLNELLTLIDQNVIRIQPYTLDDSQRPEIQARIDDWTRRARAMKMRVLDVSSATTPDQARRLVSDFIDSLETELQARDPQHCYLCDRPKFDCACPLEESESPA